VIEKNSVEASIVFHIALKIAASRGVAHRKPHRNAAATYKGAKFRW
jgi:hypothetical protein